MPCAIKNRLERGHDRSIANRSCLKSSNGFFRILLPRSPDMSQSHNCTFYATLYPERNVGRLCRSKYMHRGKRMRVDPRKFDRFSNGKSGDLFNILDPSTWFSEDSIFSHEVSGFQLIFVIMSVSAVLEVKFFNLREAVMVIHSFPDLGAACLSPSGNDSLDQLTGYLSDFRSQYQSHHVPDPSKHIWFYHGNLVPDRRIPCCLIDSPGEHCIFCQLVAKGALAVHFLCSSDLCCRSPRRLFKRAKSLMICLKVYWLVLHSVNLWQR
jgi:hypothetical protein